MLEHFKRKLLIGSYCICIGVGAYAAHDFTGTVVPLTVDQVKYGTNLGYRGVIKYIANKGEYVRPSVMDTKGNVIENGTKLISMDTEYWKKSVVSSQFALLAATENLKTARDNYERSKTLSNKDSVISRKEYETDRASYFTALSNLMKAKADLYQQQKQLEMCTLHSSIEGIVSNLYLEPGDIPAGEPVALEVTQLNPIGVKVKLPVDAINQLTSDATVKISDKISNENNNVAVLGNLSMIKGNTVTFSVANYPVYKDYLTISGKKFPVIDSFYNISKFYIYKDNSSLSVPVNSIEKDSKGSFVWSVKSIHNKQSTDFTNSVVTVNKVYIVPGKTERIQGGHTKVVILKDPGSLQENDVVIMNKSIKLKNKELICLVHNRYKLMPGDKVSIEIIS
jgi:hypothetical protein